MTPIAHRATPLGAGFGKTRFASPRDAFRILYMAENLATSVAETIVRDRFEGRRRRRMSQTEVERWGVTEINVVAPLRVVDLRGAGLLRLGLSTDASRAKSHRQGRLASEAIHDRGWPDGILYNSRLTGDVCCAVYERGVAKLVAGPVVEALTLAALVPALASLRVEIIA